VYEDVAKMVACTLVGSHLDSANSVLYGTTKETFIYYRKHKTLDVLLLVLSSPVLILFSNSSIGSPLNTALTWLIIIIIIIIIIIMSTFV